ncbi:sialidase family protein [Polaromonas sp.]|uniref:sialidase family protein n=1 Tax=Polaromonas sp. TaxID=1869339 RepID=UPI0025E43C80|nr:sialidase family protein [Polaromonas sp.]
MPPATPATLVQNGNARITLAAEPKGSQCQDPVGGIKITAFIDANNNGVLDGADVSNTQYACYQAPGAAGSASTTGITTLVSLVNEPAGRACANGGKKFFVGLDANSNGVLDVAEATTPAAYLCNSAGPDVGISIIDEPRGGNCANAGKQISTTSGAGKTVEYLCYAAPGLSTTWQRITGTAAQLVSGLGHIISSFSVGNVVATLPAEPAVKPGDTLTVRGESGNEWRITQAAGQTIGTRKLGGTEPGLETSWIQQSEPVHDWWFVASSASGSKLAAVANNFLTAPGAPKVGFVYTSADAGVTWTERQAPGDRAWASIASSADGTKLAAVASDLSRIWTSADSGNSWQEQFASGSSGRFWVSITMSSDGSRMAAVVLGNGAATDDGKIYTWEQSAGNAFGVGPWTARTPSRNWRSIASSADGSKLVAAVYNDLLDAQQPIYLSTDSGVTWTPSPAFPIGQVTHSFYRVASSQDGTKLAAAERFGKIYTSSDSGLSWTARIPDHGFNSIALSGDGNTVVAVQPLSTTDPLATGKIYISTDGGATWTQRQQASSWRGVALSADGNRIVAAVNNGRIFTSTSNRTTPGTAGSVTGGLTNELQLRYLGDGLFDATSASGPAFIVK